MAPCPDPGGGGSADSVLPVADPSSVGGIESVGALGGVQGREARPELGDREACGA